EPRAPELLAEAAADAATRGAPEAAARFLHRALDEPIDATTRAALTFELARAEFAAGGARAAEEAARGAARLSQDPRARARAEPREQVRPRAERAWGDGQLLEGEPVDGTIWTLLTAALGWSGYLERDLEICDEVLEAASARGSPLAFATASYCRIWPQLQLGR